MIQMIQRSLEPPIKTFRSLDVGKVKTELAVSCFSPTDERPAAESKARWIHRQEMV
jgi:hypothetical protein